MSSLPKAPFIPVQRIERRMEEELARAGMLPDADGSSVIDIEAFLESHLLVRLEQYAELDTDVLGVTHFLPGEKPLVQINRDLTQGADESGEAWVKGRWRITMAHEAAHVILHSGEIEAAAQQASLFGGDEDREVQRQRCMKRDLHRIGGEVDAREIQANIAMAALLMPKRVFSARAALILPAKGERGSSAYWQGVADLAGMFQVSKEAARIRIEKLGLEALVGQTQMEI